MFIETSAKAGYNVKQVRLLNDTLHCDAVKREGGGEFPDSDWSFFGSVNCVNRH